MMRAPSFLLAAVGLTASLAFAQAATDPLDVCAAQKDDAARLACFDRQIALRHGAQHPGAPAGAAAQTASPPSAVTQPPAASPASAVTQPPAASPASAVTRPPATSPPSAVTQPQAAAAPPEVVPPASASVPSQATSRSPDADYGLQGEALHKKLQEEQRQARSLPPVSATVSRLVRVSRTDYAFQLDNGQIWQQTDSRQDLIVRVNDRVTIRPGSFGDFFFITPARQHIRVKRIR